MKSNNIKVLVTVVANEFEERTYSISCGAGNQYVSWLAMAACLKFGQDHYPSGTYIPNLLTRADDDDIPHPRMRVYQEFEDGDSCKVYLKDPHAAIDSDEKRARREDMKLWYERAFGRFRNIMNIKPTWRPPETRIKNPQQYEYYISLQYKMFPEMADEFDKPELHVYPPQETIQLEIDQDNVENLEYTVFELDRPWGTYKVDLMFRKKDTQEGDDGYELQQLQDEWVKDFFKLDFEPETISLERQKQLDDEEEKQNKEKEREARNAQKELEKRKAEQKIQAQMQLLKQEQNSAKLKNYFGVMHLFFHKNEEDFNASMSLLSIYHLELHGHFLYYASCFEQYYTVHTENKMIVLQGFINFLKLMNLCQSSEQVVGLFKDTLREVEGVSNIVEDTVHNRNGFNYAQFLESLLRIGYVKADASGDQSNQAFKNALDAMFQNPNIDIANRIESDPALKDVYNKDVTELFRDNNEILCAIFSELNHAPEENYTQLPKVRFVQLLDEAGLLVKAKPTKQEEKKGAAKEKPQDGGQQSAAGGTDSAAQQVVYAEDEVLESIKPTGAFNPNYLDYFNFLESLVRVTQDRPWGTEDEGAPFLSKLQHVVSELDKTHSHCIQAFRSKRNAFNEQNRYQPQVVKALEEGAGSDDDEQ